jgi:hypothetical protein
MTHLLAAYAVDPAFYDGVVIRLDLAPDVEFRVVLPGAYNRSYLAALAAISDLSDDGGLGSVLSGQKLFLDHCLKAVNGEPPPADFAEKYAPALRELMEKAHTMADKIQSEAEAATKKPATTSNGSAIGVVG